MKLKTRAVLAFAVACAMAWPTAHALAQGVTTGSIIGIVTDGQRPVAGASVIAIHEPSGTTYDATTRADGRFSMVNMRVGGPYTVTASYVGAGTAFAPKLIEQVTVNLGVATDVTINVQAIKVSEEVTVTAQADAVFASNRTGAATTLSRETLANLPTISGRLDSVTRLTPQSGGGMSFAGQDSRMNNITVDGSYFNNSFGLRNVPGDTSGVAAISLAAVEQIQVNIAPFDVRQGNFVGAGVNTITRSGTNQFRGSIYRMFRNEGFVGTKAKALTVNPGTFTFGETGEWVAGPLIKNRLFFFQSYENETTKQPATTFRANQGGQLAGGSITRVLASDLDGVAAFLKSKFDYDPGVYQGYDFRIPGKRFLGKVDLNMGSRNKVTLRYTQLDSSSDKNMSTSSSLGNARPFGTQSMAFSASNYSILENIRSGVGQWNSVIGPSMANEFIIGYTHQDESRGDVGKLFPVVDILFGAGDTTTYMSFGSEPFTPNNELRYNTFQVQDNFTKFAGKHVATVGAALEKYHSENVFFPGKQSAYVYNSLADFYADANGYLTDASRTTTTSPPRLFQVRYMNVPGEKPVQPLDVLYVSGYAQDEWSARNSLKVTVGVRFDVAKFGDTGFANPLADAMAFRDEFGQPAQYSTAKLPDPKFLWSPRLGFNWDVAGDQKTQVRGGTGVFSGKPAYVWISNQIGNTGVLTGFDAITSSTNPNNTVRPFNPNPDAYKPTAPPTGAPAATYELALTDPNFKFPQTWRTNIGVDRRLPWGFTSTTEFIYNRDVNGIYYINANLPAPQSAYSGVDPRPRWTATGMSAIRLPANQNVIDAVVLKNQNVGRSWNVAQTLTKAFKSGLYFKTAYSYGEAKNTVDAGSIAFGSWNGNQIPGNQNTPPLAFSSYSPGHRFFLTASYSKEYFSFGRTTISTYFEARTIGNGSYVFGSDANGDGSTSNDLIYIPRNTSEMNFQTYTNTFNGVATTFTAADQANAWEAYISQDQYLSKHRGEYAMRGGVFMPLVKRLDLSITQDVFHKLFGQRHSLSIRADILNFGNLLNKNWGVGQRMISTSPLTSTSVDGSGAMMYRLRAVNGLLVNQTYQQTSSLSDVYSFMISLRYVFN